MSTQFDSPMVRVNRRARCVVCGSPDWCGFLSDGSKVVCMRVPSEKTTQNGGWLHFPNKNHAEVSSGRGSKSYTPALPVAPTDKKHAVYTDLLRVHLVLSEFHKLNLIERGLSELQIEINGYRSVPTPYFGKSISRSLAHYDLRGVAGFYLENNQWCMSVPCAGFYVPYRDSEGRVQAMQYRLDEPIEGKTKYLWLSSATRSCGASSGSPVHYANHSLLKTCDEVIVTEGALKADVIASRVARPVIAAAGVTNFGQHFAANLKEKFPNIRQAVIAFDGDFRTNPQVKAALQRLRQQLMRAGLRIVFRTWPPQFKGYDDYLVSGRK